MSGIKILVTGGRDFDDVGLMRAVLNRLGGHGAGKIKLIIHGGARGADSLADTWARFECIPRRVFPADWGTGKAARPLRNARMLEEKPDLVVAFPGGKGTADMVRQAKLARVRTIIVLSESK